MGHFMAWKVRYEIPGSTMNPEEIEAVPGPLGVIGLGFARGPSVIERIVLAESLNDAITVFASKGMIILAAEFVDHFPVIALNKNEVNLDVLNFSNEVKTPAQLDEEMRSELRERHQAICGKHGEPARKNIH